MERMKSFGSKAWLLPQPVLIIGTYNENGEPNAMNAAWAGTWDYHEIMISMGAHATTENLNRCNEFTVAFATAETLVASDFVGIASAKKDRMERSKIRKHQRPCFHRFSHDHGMQNKTKAKRIGKRLLYNSGSGEHSLR